MEPHFRWYKGGYPEKYSPTDPKLPVVGVEVIRGHGFTDTVQRELESQRQRGLEYRIIAGI